MPRESTTRALGKAVYSTRCLSKGLGPGAALDCPMKTNTDLFSLVGKTMVNSAEWNQLGIFVASFFFYYANDPVPTLMWDFVWHPVQVRTDSVVFNLMDEGEYRNHRPFLRCCFFLFESYADALAFVHHNVCWQSRCFTECALLPHVFDLTLRESHFGYTQHETFPTWPL